MTQESTQSVAASAIRFLAAGGTASLVNWLVRFPLSLVLPFTGAVAIAYCVGMTLGFVLYQRWVFPGSTRSLWRQIVMFCAVNAVGLATVVASADVVRQAILQSGLAQSGAAGALAHLTAIAIGACVNFLGHRVATFGSAPLQNAEGVGLTAPIRVGDLQHPALAQK